MSLHSSLLIKRFIRQKVSTCCIYSGIFLVPPAAVEEGKGKGARTESPQALCRRAPARGRSPPAPPAQGSQLVSACVFHAAEPDSRIITERAVITPCALRKPIRLTRVPTCRELADTWLVLTICVLEFKVTVKFAWFVSVTVSELPLSWLTVPAIPRVLPFPPAKSWPPKPPRRPRLPQAEPLLRPKPPPNAPPGREPGAAFNREILVAVGYVLLAS